jgi:hypothetical protein
MIGYICGQSFGKISGLPLPEGGFGSWKIFESDAHFSTFRRGPEHVFGKPVSVTSGAGAVEDGPAESSEAAGQAPVTVNFLERYCQNQWEAVLHYMCRTDSNAQMQTKKEPLKKGVLRLLESSGLMAKVNVRDGDPMEIDDDVPQRRSGSAANGATSESLRITSKGFQFLLQDVNTQIWAFLLQWIELAEELQMDQVEMIQMLFFLGSMQQGVVS